MPTAAGKKFKLMILSANVPILIISGEALNNDRNISGKAWNKNVPTAIIASANKMLYRIVPLIRSFFRAP